MPRRNNPGDSRDPDYYFHNPRLDPLFIVQAYAAGFFPWYNPGEAVRYYQPSERAILVPREVHVSRSLRRQVRAMGFSCAVDVNFSATMAACAEVHTRREGGTWIGGDLQGAFERLHGLGLAHSLEVYQGEVLCGGVYGLSLGSIFFGESMFFSVSGASKCALASLAYFLDFHSFDLVDCQILSRHLQTLGVRGCVREEFAQHLRGAVERPTLVGNWGRGGAGSAGFRSWDDVLALCSSGSA